MDDSTLVHRFEGAQQLVGEAHRFIDGQRALGEAIRQRGPLHAVHRVVEEAVGLADGVNRYDVGITEAGEHAGLAEEALGRCRRGHLGLQDLDRDGSLELDLAGEENRAHAARAELALHFVIREQSDPQPF